MTQWALWLGPTCSPLSHLHLPWGETMQIFVLLQIGWYLNFTDQERYLKFTTNGLANLPEKGYPYSMQWSNLMQHQSENIMDTCDIFSIDKFAQICMYLALSNISVLLKPWKSCDIHIGSVIPSFDIFPHQLFFSKLHIRYTKPTLWLDCGFRL